MSGLWRRNCLYNVQVAGLAAHALEPDEEIDVLEHLPRCPSCRAALREAERVLAGLGTSIEQVDPPASLRGMILAEAAETVQTTPIEQPRVAAEGAADAHAAARHRRPSDGVPSRPVSIGRPGLSRRGQLLAASMVLVGLVTIGGLAAHSVQLTEQRDAEIAQAQTLAEIVTGFDAPGVRHATLAASDGKPLAAVVVRAGQRTLVTAGELAPNAADRDTYVVWGIGVGGPRAISTFDILAAGTDVRSVGPDVPADNFSGYAISIEPGRVAPAEPSTVVAVGQLQA